MLATGPKKQLKKAQGYREQGKFEKALECIAMALEDNSTDFNLLLELANLHLWKGIPSEAVSTFRRALKSNPDKLNQLLDHVEWAVEINPEISELKEFLLEKYAEISNLPEVGRIAATLTAAELSNAIVKYRNRKDSLVQYKANPEVLKGYIDAAYLLIFLCHNKGLYEEVRELCYDIVRSEPDEVENVIDLYSSLLQSSTDSAKGRLFLGDLLMELGEKDMAINQFASALRLDRDVAKEVAERTSGLVTSRKYPLSALWTLTLAQIAESELDNALKNIKKIIEKDAAYVPRAVQVLYKIVQRDPEYYDCHLLLGDCYFRLENMDSAVESFVNAKPGTELRKIISRFKDVVAKWPDESSNYMMLGDLYLERGRVKDALTNYRKGYELDPSNKDELIAKLTKTLESDYGNLAIHLELSDLCIENKVLDKAVILLRHVLKIAPDEVDQVLNRLVTLSTEFPGVAEVQLALGESYFIKEDYEKALIHMRSALSKDERYLPVLLRNFVMICSQAPDTYKLVSQVLKECKSKGKSIDAVEFAWAESAVCAGALARAVSKYLDVYRANPERYDYVERALNKMIRESPDHVEIELGLIDLYFLSDRYLEALERLASILDKDVSTFPRIEEKYKEYLDRDPDNWAVRQGLVEGYYAVGKLDRVIEECKTIVSNDRSPVAAQSYLRLGDAYFQKGYLTDSIKNYLKSVEHDNDRAQEIIDRVNKVLQVEPTLLPAQFGLARLLSFCGRVDEAVKVLINVERFDSKRRDYVASELAEIAKKDLSNPIVSLTLADIEVERRNYRQAIESLGAMIERDSEYLDKVIVKLEEIKELDAQRFEVHYQLGRAYQSKNWITKSVESYLDAVRGDADYAEKVVKRYREIIEDSSDILEPYVALSEIYVLQFKFPAALMALSEAMGALPDRKEWLLEKMAEISAMNDRDEGTLHLLAQAFAEAGEHERALDIYQTLYALNPRASDQLLRGYTQLIDKNPEFSRCYLERAKLKLSNLELQGCFEDLKLTMRYSADKRGQVILVLQEIINKDPLFLSAVMYLSDLLFIEKRYGEAIAVLEERLNFPTQEKGRLNLYLRVGKIHLIIGKPTEAREAFEHARKFAEDEDSFLEELHKISVSFYGQQVRKLKHRLGRYNPENRTELERLIIDVQEVVDKLITLGELEEAKQFVNCLPEALDDLIKKPLLCKIHVRDCSYGRALEFHQAARVKLTDNKSFVMAERTGELSLAVAILESKYKNQPTAHLERRLRADYLHLVQTDLEGRGKTLMRETKLTFKE